MICVHNILLCVKIMCIHINLKKRLYVKIMWCTIRYCDQNPITLEKIHVKISIIPKKFIYFKKYKNWMMNSIDCNLKNNNFLLLSYKNNNLYSINCIHILIMHQHKLKLKLNCWNCNQVCGICFHDVIYISYKWIPISIIFVT